MTTLATKCQMKSPATMEPTRSRNGANFDRGFMAGRYRSGLRRPFGALPPWRHFLLETFDQVETHQTDEREQNHRDEQFWTIPSFRRIAQQITESGVGSHQLGDYHGEQGAAHAQAHARDNVGQGARQANFVGGLPWGQTQRFAEFEPNRIEVPDAGRGIQNDRYQGDFEHDDD